MKGLLKKWFDRGNAAAYRRYQDGFGWAMAEYFTNDKCIQEIESWSDSAKAMGNYTVFDQGIDRAVKILERIEEKEKFVDETHKLFGNTPLSITTPIKEIE